MYAHDYTGVKLTELFPVLPKPNSGYPTYQGGDALVFLKENWGRYLKYFSPQLDKDYLYQGWLRVLDAQLMIALDVQVRQKHHMKLADFVPPKKVRLGHIKAMEEEFCLRFK